MKCLIFLFFISTFILSESFAQSDLLINPYRVVFEGGKSIEEISVANTGQDTARYVMSFVQYKMNEFGALQQITEPEEGQYFADRLVRMFPRSVVLPPGEAQTVRLQVRAPSGTVEGEYRSHLYFRSVRDQKQRVERTPADTTLGIRLTPIYGITIPVIVRLGTLDLNVDVDSVGLEWTEDDTPHLRLQATRSGTKSSFGNIEINYISDENEEIRVANLRGIALYVPNKKRYFSIPLSTDDPRVNYSTGELKVRYFTSGGHTQKEFFSYNYSLDY